MRISLEWLSEYLPGPLDPHEAAEALTQGGLPVELIETQDNDTVIDVEVTSNRGDCLSHVGIARELAAVMGREFRDVEPMAAEVPPPASSLARVQIEAPRLCPHYTARLIRGVKILPSPPWMARRLGAVLRSREGEPYRLINNVVDVTNYVMFEMGQPLHAFDFQKLHGHEIVVRSARAGERLISIDGKERILTPDMLAIADASRPVALAGVMGGVDSEISASTVDLLLESARFDPLSVRKTARALDLRSDSSYRFERGIDSTLAERASLRAAQLILDTAGGQLLSGVLSAGADDFQAKKLTLRLTKLKQVLGVEWPVELVMNALTRLRLAPVLRGERIEVTVPSYRLDLNIEVDLIEEVARIVGYDKIPSRDEIAIRVKPPEPALETVNLIRSTLIAAGYYESVTFSFVSDVLAEDFLPAENVSPTSPLPKADVSVRDANARLRPSLLPGLLESVARNQNAGTSDPKLFEIGATFWNAPGGEVQERQSLALVGSSEFREVRGTVEALLNKLDPKRDVQAVPENRSGFARGACGRVEWGVAGIGTIGKISRAVAEKLSLREVPAAAELEMSALLSGAQRVPQLQPLPKYPPVRRDLSLVVSESTRYEALESLIREERPQWLEGLEYITTYRGKPLEKGSKSVTVTLIFRSPDVTLTGEQVESSVQGIVSAARQKLNATLRA